MIGLPDSVVAGREMVARLFAAAIEEAEPSRAVRNSLSITDETLMVDGHAIVASDGIHIIAVGKAAVAMTRGALESLGGAVVSGDVITKDGHVDGSLPSAIRIFEAGHPIPDQRGVDATRAALEALRDLPAEAVVLALVSGGGSALLEAPRDGVSLADFARTTDLLLRAGAPIDALNAVRAPLSQVKAGGLRNAAPSAKWITLILSDVLGNDPRVIASGPTVAGRIDPAFALATIDRFGVAESLPGSVMRSLSDHEPTVAPGADNDVLLIVGDNAAAVQAAAREAEAAGLSPAIVWSAKEGEASQMGREFVTLAVESSDGADVLLGGGEMTVTVHGSGQGGRNTEFALAAALELERRRMDDWVVASLGTDGQDATTGLAGAIADSGTASRARARGIDPEAALKENDSLAVFQAAGGGVETGPTGTNVNDVYIALRLGAVRKRQREVGS